MTTEQTTEPSVDKLASVDFDTASWGATPQATEPTVEAVAPEIDAAVETPKENEIDFNSLLSERTGGKYKTVEDLMSEQPAAQVQEFKFDNDYSAQLFEHFKSGDIDKILDIAYSQQMLGKVDTLEDVDVIKMKIAFENPDYSDEDVDDEYLSKYERESQDEELMDEDELKKYKKEQKAFDRTFKKEVKEAKQYLTDKRQELKLPNLKNTVEGQGEPVDIEKAVADRLSEQQKAQQETYSSARNGYLKTIDDAIKQFDGFTVDFKDEDVQFSGKHSLSDVDKAALKSKAEAFDVDDYYINRYSKDGLVDTKQILEDIYLLENREKILQSITTQAVSKAKADLLRNIKGIDYEQSRQRFSPSPEDRQVKAADFFFSR